MSSEACTVVHIERAVRSGLLRDLKGHAENLKRYASLIEQPGISQSSELEHIASILLELAVIDKLARQLAEMAAL